MDVSGVLLLIVGGLFLAVVVAILIWVVMDSKRGA